MKLLGIITSTGSLPIGSELRNATMNLYHDGSYQADIKVQLKDPKVGDRYDVVIMESRS